MYDAVNLLTAAIPELQLTQHITTEPANCEDVKKWAQGLGVASYMKVVRNTKPQFNLSV